MAFESFSFSKLAFAYKTCSMAFRLLQNCRIAEEKISYGELIVGEIKDSEIHIIREVQQDAFANEYHQWLKGKQVKNDSKLIPLQPCIDEDGLLQCNGRLR